MWREETKWIENARLNYFALSPESRVWCEAGKIIRNGSINFSTQLYFLTLQFQWLSEGPSDSSVGLLICALKWFVLPWFACSSITQVNSVFLVTNLPFCLIPPCAELQPVTLCGLSSVVCSYTEKSSVVRSPKIHTAYQWSMGIEDLSLAVSVVLLVSTQIKKTWILGNKLISNNYKNEASNPRCLAHHLIELAGRSLCIFHLCPHKYLCAFLLQQSIVVGWCNGYQDINISLISVLYEFLAYKNAQQPCVHVDVWIFSGGISSEASAATN